MVLAGLSTLVPAMAQNAQNPQRLRARAAAPAIKNGRPTDIYILSANGPMVQFVESRESQEVLQQMASAFKTLYIFETDDFVDAKVAMENRKYQDARNKFHALVNKYASTLSIKDSLSARAAVYELECAMRMMDWAGVKGLLAKFPVRGSNLSPSAQDDLEVAKIMALIPDKDWNGVKSRAASFLATKKNATRLQQARMKYALGAAAMVAQDWNKALEKAGKSGQPVLVDFTGSDWCPGCIYLRKNIFDTDAFAKYAEDNNFVLVELDFPRTEGKMPPEQLKFHEELMRRYGISVFPSVSTFMLPFQ